MIEDDIARVLGERGIKWTRNEKKFVPAAADVSAVLDGAYSALAHAPEDTEYFQGGILVRKENELMNIYLYFGEL